jgi:hypothetical protein
MINYNYYKLDNKRYYLYIDIDEEKIKGNYTDKLFDIAVDEFINKNYTDSISPLLRSRDSSGKRNYTSQSATDVVKGKLQLYRG